MAFWAYQLIDHTGRIIAMDSGYETEEDAEIAAKEHIKYHSLLSIKTYQVWEDI
jgi:hypothetical protein